MWAFPQVFHGVKHGDKMTKTCSRKRAAPSRRPLSVSERAGFGVVRCTSTAQFQTCSVPASPFLFSNPDTVVKPSLRCRLFKGLLSSVFLPLRMGCLSSALNQLSSQTEAGRAQGEKQGEKQPPSLPPSFLTWRPRNKQTLEPRQPLVSPLFSGISQPLFP